MFQITREEFKEAYEKKFPNDQKATIEESNMLTFTCEKLADAISPDPMKGLIGKTLTLIDFSKDNSIIAQSDDGSKHHISVEQLLMCLVERPRGTLRNETGDVVAAPSPKKKPPHTLKEHMEFIHKHLKHGGDDADVELPPKIKVLDKLESSIFPNDCYALEPLWEGREF